MSIHELSLFSSIRHLIRLMAATSLPFHAVTSAPARGYRHPPTTGFARAASCSRGCARCGRSLSHLTQQLTTYK
jgi:hypothetical protein